MVIFISVPHLPVGATIFILGEIDVRNEFSYLETLHYDIHIALILVVIFISVVPSLSSEGYNNYF